MGLKPKAGMWIQMFSQWVLLLFASSVLLLVMWYFKISPNNWLYFVLIFYSSTYPIYYALTRNMK